jgi:lipoprotein-releasing system ATP-binding protein
MSEWVLQARGLSRRYHEGSLDVPVLQEVNLDVRAGQSVAIVGASGSGKSSLLHLLAGLDTPTQGQVCWQGEDIARFSDAELGERRNRLLGFVFQFHHLLSEFSALENAAMPLWVRRLGAEESARRAQQALHGVGLASRMHHRPSELSGGERQRVALARAMVTDPACILADEPTGNLDRETAADMFDLLQSACLSRGTALVLVTHDDELARRCDRLLRLHQGRLTET